MNTFTSTAQSYGFYVLPASACVRLSLASNCTSSPILSHRSHTAIRCNHVCTIALAFTAPLLPPPPWPAARTPTPPETLHRQRPCQTQNPYQKKTESRASGRSSRDALALNSESHSVGAFSPAPDLHAKNCGGESIKESWEKSDGRMHCREPADENDLS